MAINNDTLYTMVGRVLQGRAAGSAQAIGWINDAIRIIINKRTYWNDLRKTTNLKVNDLYKAGTVNMTSGDATVIGTATAWPVNDVVDTTLAEPVLQTGPARVLLNNMAGVDENSVLLVGAGTPNEEYVVCQRIGNGMFGPNSIHAFFTKLHNENETVTQSSMVGRQLRVETNDPIYSIIGVKSATELELDNKWQDATRLNATYKIVNMYYTIFPNIRKIIIPLDIRQGIMLDCTKTQQDLALMDPQRSQGGDPVWLASAFPNVNNNMRWELWPAPTSARQIFILASQQWPELKNDDDIPPPFLEPTIITDMALSRAVSVKIGSDDKFFDPNLGKYYYDRALAALEDAYGSDEDLSIQDLISRYGAGWGLPGANAEFWLSRSVEQLEWNF